MQDDQAPSAPVLGAFVGIDMQGGITEQFKPFMHIRAFGTLPDGTEVCLYGQIEPDDARDHALRYLAVAESCVSDAAVGRFLEAQGLDFDAAAKMVTALREFRADALGDGDES